VGIDVNVGACVDTCVTVVEVGINVGVCVGIDVFVGGIGVFVDTCVGGIVPPSVDCVSYPNPCHCENVYSVCAPDFTTNFRTVEEIS
jgi:hypothetical protein